MHCKMKNVFLVPEQICDPGYAIATPQLLILESNSYPLGAFSMIIVYFIHVIFITYLFISELLMESGNLCLMNQKKRQNSDWPSQRNFKDRWLRA